MKPSSKPPRPPFPPKASLAALIGALLVGAGVGYGLFAYGGATSHGAPGPEARDGAAGSTAQAGQPAGATSTGKPVYTCPMHPQVLTDHPASCPICGMDLVLEAAAAATSGQPAEAASTGKPVYTCPMHPQVLTDHPGSCPICGMDLVLKPAAHGEAPAPTLAQGAHPTLEPGVQAVTLSPRQRVLANVETAPVERGALGRTIETTGRVAVDEARLSSLSAWIDGRIDELAVKTTGASIRQGALIARLYSPELVATQQEYLTARQSAREMATSPYPELAQGARSLVAATRQRLKLMGLTEAQLRRLEASGKPIVSFPVLAPSSGVVVARKVQQGQYVKAGDVLFELADYSRVWVEATAYEADLGALKPGARAEVRLAAWPDRVFAGTVGFIEPVLEAETRTAKLRIALANPQGLLKPEMYANVRVTGPAEAPDALTVPASAVIATGRHHVVYVEAAPNQFVPRTVRVGAKAGDRYPVLSGLKLGERVASSGGFLLDASSQLSGAADAGATHAKPAEPPARPEAEVTP